MIKGDGVRNEAELRGKKSRRSTHHLSNGKKGNMPLENISLANHLVVLLMQRCTHPSGNTHSAP